VKPTWDRPESDANGLIDPSSARISRRASLLRGAIGFAGMLALVGCAAGESDSLQSASLEPNGDIGSLLEGQAPMVAGEALDAELLRRFYARRGFEPVWITRQAQANALRAAVLRARDHGLDPEMFHANLLRRMDMFPPVRRDLLLSHAVLTVGWLKHRKHIVEGAHAPLKQVSGVRALGEFVLARV
jgi:hypothetical protein